MNKQTSFTSFISWCGKRVALAVPIILSLAYFGSGVAHAQVINNTPTEAQVLACGAFTDLADTSSGTSETLGAVSDQIAGTYCYGVRASNAGGSSASEYAIFTIVAPGAAINPLASFTGTGNDAVVTVTFTRPSELGNPPATGFQVQRRLETQPDQFANVGTVITTGTAGVAGTYTSTGTVPPGDYRYRVVSVAVHDGNNANSPETAAGLVNINATGSSAPLTFTAVYDATGNVVNLNWAAPTTPGDNFVSWDLNVSTDGTTTYTDLATVTDQTTLTYIHNGILPGRQYVYQLSAISDGTDTPALSTAFYTPPSAPANVRLVLNNAGNWTLEWNATPAEETVTEYNVSSKIP